MNLTIRKVESDHEYAESLRLRNLVFRHNPFTLEESRAMDEAFPKDKFFVRYLGWTDAGVAVARMNVREDSIPDSRLFYCDTWVFPPLGVEEWIEMHRFTESMARTAGEGVLMAFAFSYETTKIAGLEAMGYELKQINPQSEIHLETIDEAKFRSYIDAIAGVEIVSVAEYARRHPDRWMYEYWRLDMDLSYDIPMPTPFKEMPFDDYRKILEDPNVNYTTRFFALVDGHPVGITELQPNRVDPSIASTYLTGVRKEYRRRGIARALKATVLLHARSIGVKRIAADNEEANPMYQLNLSLGFQHSLDWRFYRKPD